MTNKADNYLIRDINHILSDGIIDKNPRPKYKDGTPAHTIFVTHNIRQYDLSKGEFPITILRPIAWKGAIKEMLWIFQDQSNDLSILNNKYNNKIWNDWESEDMPNTIGCRYGHTVKEYDLMNRLLNDIIINPYGRYHIINLWQEEEFQRSDGLKPCAYETIWSVRGEFLDMYLTQRSGDMLVASGAGNWNEVQYAALLMMVARHTGYQPGKFTHFVVNEQIYNRHIEQANELKNRYKHIEQDEFFHDKTYGIPYLTLNKNAKDFYNITIDDFEMIDYEPIKPQITFELGI